MNGNNKRFQDTAGYGWVIPLVISGILLLAHSPVLFSTYLRQDDWSAALWNIHHLDSFPDLYIHIVEEVRPVSVIFLMLSDAIAYHMHNAWIARLINILLLGAAAILTYKWQ